ncbi:MAG: hypothetical protein AAF337_12490, partial [Pseudomonadota bacterium]
ANMGFLKKQTVRYVFCASQQLFLNLSENTKAQAVSNQDPFEKSVSISCVAAFLRIVSKLKECCAAHVFCAARRQAAQRCVGKKTAIILSRLFFPGKQGETAWCLVEVYKPHG